MSYSFDKRQVLKLKLYDADSERPNLRDHDFLGYADCSLKDVIHSGRVSMKRTKKTLLMLPRFLYHFAALILFPIIA